MVFNFSEKQAEIVYGEMKRVNLYCGVTGSGKSYAANIRVYAEVCGMGGGRQVVFTGNTLDSLERNVIYPMMELDRGVGWLKYTRNPARLQVRGGCVVFCVGVNTEQAQDKIQGGSIDLWYADEPTTYPKTAWDMLMSRLRGLENGVLVIKPMVGTLNPADDLHWLKVDVIDKIDERDLNYVEFGFKDNPTITDEYVDAVKQRFTGVFYDRMIEGKWVGDKDFKVFPEMGECEKSVVCDFKVASNFIPTGAMDVGFEDATGYLLGYYDFREGVYCVRHELLMRRATTEEIHKAIVDVERLMDTRRITRWSDTDLRIIADLYQMHGMSFAPTPKDNKPAQINQIRVLLKQGKIKIHPDCKRLIAQMKSCAWDKNRTKFIRTSEGHFDLCDCMIYFVRNADTSTNPYPEWRDEAENFYAPKKRFSLIPAGDSYDR